MAGLARTLGLTPAQRQAARALKAALAALPGPIRPESLTNFGAEAAQVAATHGLLPLLGAARAPGVIFLPEVEALHARVKVQLAFQAEKVRRTFAFARQVLTEAGVDFLPLKGRSLALRLYNDPALRRSGDVDVLVAEADLQRALSALERAGCALPSFVSRDYYQDSHHHLLLGTPKGLAPLELHFALQSDLGHGLVASEVFARTTTLPLDGAPVRVMDPADEFVYLATHAAVHGFTPMMLLTDLAYLSPRADPARVGELARRYRVEVPLGVAWSLCAEWFGRDPERYPVSPRARAQVRAVRPLYAAPLLLAAVHSSQARYLPWVTQYALHDSRRAATRRLLHNLGRVVKRRARGRLGDLVPVSWGD